MSEWLRVLALVNSRLERPAETKEDFPDAVAAGRWLADSFGERGESEARLSDAEYEAMRRLRGGMRTLILNRIAGQEPDLIALDVLNEFGARVARTDRLTPKWSCESLYSTRTGAQHSPTARLATLATEAIELLSDLAVDLAECAADDCVVLFVRTDPRRRWHSDRCGNRVRAMRSYARKRS